MINLMYACSILKINVDNIKKIMSIVESSGLWDILIGGMLQEDA